MTQHSNVLEIERPIAANDTIKRSAGGYARQRYQERGSPDSLGNKTVRFPQDVNGWGQRWRCWLAQLGMAGITGPSAGIWFTDDAYVKADSTTIAPKVSGYLREVLVGDNDAASTPARRWRGSTSATSRWRSTRPKPT